MLLQCVFCDTRGQCQPSKTGMFSFYLKRSPQHILYGPGYSWCQHLCQRAIFLMVIVCDDMLINFVRVSSGAPSAHIIFYYIQTCIKRVVLGWPTSFQKCSTSSDIGVRSKLRIKTKKVIRLVSRAQCSEFRFWEICAKTNWICVCACVDGQWWWLGLLILSWFESALQALRLLFLLKRGLNCWVRHSQWCTCVFPRLLSPAFAFWDTDPFLSDLPSSCSHLHKEYTTDCYLRGWPAKGRAGCELWCIQICTTGLMSHTRLMSELTVGDRD